MKKRTNELNRVTASAARLLAGDWAKALLPARRALAMLLAVLLLAGCTGVLDRPKAYADLDETAAAETAPQPEVTPEPTAEPEESPEPTAEPEETPEPTAQPEETPEPTTEPEVTPGPTAEPEESPEPTAQPEETPEPTEEPELEEEPAEPGERQIKTGFTTIRIPDNEELSFRPAGIRPEQLVRPESEGGSLTLAEAWSFLGCDEVVVGVKLRKLPQLQEGEELILTGLSYSWKTEPGEFVGADGLASAELLFTVDKAIYRGDFRLGDRTELNSARIAGFALWIFTPAEPEVSEETEAASEETAKPAVRPTLAQQTLSASILSAAPAAAGDPAEDAAAPVREAVTLTGLLPVGGAVQARAVSVPLLGRSVYAAYEITVLDAAGKPWQPTEGELRVQVTSAGLTDAKTVHVFQIEDGDAPQRGLLAATSAVDSSVSFTAQQVSTFALASAILEKHLVASDGKEYVVTATFDALSGIPADAELVVNEILPGSAAYASYVSRSVARAGKTADDLDFARAFDIYLLDPATREHIQPTKDVSISVELLQEALGRDAEVSVVHFGDRVELMDSRQNGDAVEFATSGFSVFVVAAYVVEKEITASDGHTYKITVTCGEDAGIPAGAELEVREILPGTDAYASYITGTAEEAGIAERDITLARVFDISLVDPETGEHYQPTRDVAVSIELMETVKRDNESVSVVHFGERTEALDNSVSGDTVSFTTDGFSVYVVVAAPAPLGVDWEKATTVAELDGRGFYMSINSTNANRSAYYFMDEIVATKKQIRKTPANDITQAAVYYFTLVEGETDVFYINCLKNDVAYFIRFPSGAAIDFTTDISEATAFTVSFFGSDGSSGFKIGAGGKFFNLQGIDSGPGFQAAAADRALWLTYANSSYELHDPYGLEGQRFGIVYVSGSSGKAMTTTANGSNALSGENVTVATVDGERRVTKASGDLTLWSFEATEDGTYYIRANNGKYLSLTSSGLTLVDAKSSATAITVSPGTAGESNWEGKYRFSVNDYEKEYVTVIRCNSSGGRFYAETANSNANNSDSWFFLVRLKGIEIAYVYEADPADAANGRTPKNLPADSAETVPVETGSYTAEPPARTTYYSEDAEHRYTYTFDHWDYDGAAIAPGESIDLSSLGYATVTLKAVWSGPTVTDRPILVAYDMNEPAAVSGYIEIAGEEFSTVRNAGDSPEEKSGVWAQDYPVQDLTARYYKRIKTAGVTAHFPYMVYRFVGWQLEDGVSLVQPNDVINLMELSGGESVYDRNNDGTVTLKAVWRNIYDTGTGLPTASFTIWTTIYSADSHIDTDTLLSEQASKYSPAVGSAVMFAYDANGKEVWTSPSHGAGGAPNTGYYYTAGPGTTQPAEGKYMMITYVGSTILTADEQTRRLAASGFTTTAEDFSETSQAAQEITGSPDVTWKLSYLPSDEEVFAQLRSFVAAGTTVLRDENDQIISADELTTDNFIVRWCQVKYQSGNRDGWNISAKLTRRVSYVRITKTFYGDDQAIAAAIDQGFNITLTSVDDSSQVITLSMADRTGGEIADGKIDDTHYGYIERNGNTYSWTVMCSEPTTFKVKENEYQVTLGDVIYGIRAQYNQTDTGNAADEILRVFSSEEQITTTAHPSDESLSAVETTNFYNTYIPEGVFVIDKTDENGIAMPNVRFAVYGSSGSPLQLFQPEGSHGGQYNVLYENGDSADVALTDAQGSIYLKLPQPDSGAYTYTIHEIIPRGYQGYGGENTFTVTVDSDGLFYAASGTIRTGSSFTALSAGGEVYGVRLSNTTNKAALVVSKTWAPGVTPEDSVTITLYKTVNGATSTVATLTLDGDNGWTQTLADYPLMVRNSRIVYSVKETKIGSAAEGSPAFAYWIPELRPTVYRRGGEKVQEGEPNGSIPDAVYSADEIVFAVENDRLANTDVTVRLRKVDARDDAVQLPGAQFWLYRALDDPSAVGESTVSYNGVTVQTGSPAIRTTDSSGPLELKLHYSSTYYIKEYVAPDGYELLSGIFRVVIDGEGAITVEKESAISDLVTAGAQSGTSIDVTVKNRPATAVLTVRKTVTGGFGDLDPDNQFVFTLVSVADEASGTSYPWTKTVNGTVTTGSISTSDGSNTFTLAHGESIQIVLPMERAIELSEAGGDYTVTWQIDDETASSGNSKTVTLTGDATLTVTNDLSGLAPTDYRGGRNIGGYLWLLLVGLLLAALALVKRRRGREQPEEEDGGEPPGETAVPSERMPEPPPDRPEKTDPGGGADGETKPPQEAPPDSA